METLSKGSILYRGTPYGKQKFPTEDVAWFTADREVALAYAQNSWRGRTLDFVEEAEKTPSVRKYTVTKTLHLPFAKHTELGDVLAHYGEKAGLGEYPVLRAAINKLGWWSSADGWVFHESHWDENDRARLGESVMDALRSLGQFREVGGFLLHLCKKTDFHGWIASHEDGGSEVLLCDPTSVLKANSRQNPYRNREEHEEAKVRKEKSEEWRVEIRQEFEEKARKKQEEDEFERKRAIVFSVFFYGGYDVNRSDPEVKELLRHWDEYLTDADFRMFGGSKTEWLRGASLGVEVPITIPYLKRLLSYLEDAERAPDEDPLAYWRGFFSAPLRVVTRILRVGIEQASYAYGSGPMTIADLFGRFENDGMPPELIALVRKAVGEPKPVRSPTKGEVQTDFNNATQGLSEALPARCTLNVHHDYLAEAKHVAEVRIWARAMLAVRSKYPTVWSVFERQAGPVVLEVRPSGSAEASWSTHLTINLQGHLKSLALAQHTLVHEIGHAFEDLQPDTFEIDTGRALYGKPPFSHQYMQERPVEDFAECFRQFFTESALLRRTAPAKYTDMQARISHI